MNIYAGTQLPKEINELNQHTKYQKYGQDIANPRIQLLNKSLYSSPKQNINLYTVT